MAVTYTATKYESDAEGIYNIRVSSAALTVLTNAAPTGAVTDAHVDVSVGNHGQKRKKGINSRGFILERFTGTGAAKKRYTTFLPILTKTVYGAFAKGTTVTLQGTDWTTFDTVAET